MGSDGQPLHLESNSTGWEMVEASDFLYRFELKHKGEVPDTRLLMLPGPMTLYWFGSTLLEAGPPPFPVDSLECDPVIEIPRSAVESVPGIRYLAILAGVSRGNAWCRKAITSPFINSRIKRLTTNCSGDCRPNTTPVPNPGASRIRNGPLIYLQNGRNHCLTIFNWRPLNHSKGYTLNHSRSIFHSIAMTQETTGLICAFPGRKRSWRSLRRNSKRSSMLAVIWSNFRHVPISVCRSDNLKN